MGNFDQGNIIVRFDKVEFSENDNEVINYLDLDVSFIVLDGSFYNSEDGETYNFSSGENPFDDFVSYFEFKEEIVSVVEGFVDNILKSFGYKQGAVSYPYVDFNW